MVEHLYHGMLLPVACDMGEIRSDSGVWHKEHLSLAAPDEIAIRYYCVQVTYELYAAP